MRIVGSRVPADELACFVMQPGKRRTRPFYYNRIQREGLSEIVGFLGRGSGIHMAVVCGDVPRWSSNDFASVLKENRGRTAAVQEICLDGMPSALNTTTCYCAVVEKQTLYEAMVEVTRILYEIKTRVQTAKEHCDAVRNLDVCAAAIQAEGRCGAAQRKIWNETRASQMTQWFRVLSDLQYFPEVRFLIYLSAEQFELFTRKDRYFPKQIKMALLLKNE